jgi:hypothetical protein
VANQPNYVWRVVVFSASRDFWSKIHTTFYDFPSKEEALKCARDEDKSLRQTYEYVWMTADWFYTANIIAFVVSPVGDTTFGYRHFCLDEEEIRKECKDRQLDFDACMAKRKEVSEEDGIEFKVKFSS